MTTYRKPGLLGASFVLLFLAARRRTHRSASNFLARRKPSLVGR